MMTPWVTSIPQYWVIGIDLHGCVNVTTMSLLNNTPYGATICNLMIVHCATAAVLCTGECVKVSLGSSSIFSCKPRNWSLQSSHTKHPMLWCQGSVWSNFVTVHRRFISQLTTLWARWLESLLTSYSSWIGQPHLTCLLPEYLGLMI